ncbi:MAG: fused MFS/spermidine synthase, partial [Rhodospirillaceae bacterium]|nr:fused MFS/spermidine synthase [Rhodospirillaceae bacterium]
FAHSGHKDAANPYILYAASNVGSILALLAYPVVLEPLLSLGQQSLAWALGFVLLALLIGACAWLLLGRYQAQGADDRAALEIGLSNQVSWGRRLHWLALAFVPSMLLLGVTQHISTDVASAPMLWVVPLILYLGTFVVVFSSRPAISARLAMFLQVPLVMLLALVFFWQIHSLLLVLPLHLGVFFFAALVCHGELAKRRPAPSRLTEFYLWMSLGGVLGGAFTALLAPQIFDTVLEYPIALVAACLLRPDQEVGKAGPITWWRATPLMVLLILLALPRLAGYSPGGLPLFWLLLYMIPAALLIYGCRGRPLLFAAAIGTVLLAGVYDQGSRDIAIARSFFGVNKVIAQGSGDDKALVFKHGTTKHGLQYLDPERRRTPLAYYHRKGPLGQVFQALGDRLRHVGGVGLGVGTAACYRRAGQRWTFYEIDPLVVSFARDRGYFHYLTDCAPDARMVIGDGRLSLEREARLKEAPGFDLLILDAFSSDAIPLHLVTREAIAVYLSRLAPGGLMLFHISNRHLDLRPVLADLAGDAGIKAYVQHDAGNRDEGRYGSIWVAMARADRDMKPVLDSGKWRQLIPRPARRIWTDDYGNLIGIMRWWLELQGD